MDRTISVWNELAKTIHCQQVVGSDGVIQQRWLTCPVRLAFVALDKPKANEQGKESFGATLLFLPDADLTVLKAAVREAALGKFGAKIAPTSLRLPFRDQGEKSGSYQGFTAGALYFNATSQMRPVVFGATMDPIDAATAAYSGMIARVKLSCYAYDKAGNRGVSFGLVAVQKLADGERFGGGGNAEDGFGALPGVVKPNGAGAPAVAGNPGTGW